MSDDQVECEWVSVSSGTGLPGLSRTKAVNRLCVYVFFFTYLEGVFILFGVHCFWVYFAQNSFRRFWHVAVKNTWQPWKEEIGSLVLS